MSLDEQAPRRRKVNAEVTARKEARRLVAGDVRRMGELNAQASWLLGVLSATRPSSAESEAARGELAEMARDVERQLEAFRLRYRGISSPPIVNVETAIARLLQRLTGLS